MSSEYEKAAQSAGNRAANLADQELQAGCRLATLRKRSQLDFEIEFFERILTRDPNYVEVLTNLGDLFARKGCHRRALLVDLRLVQLQPKNAMAMYNLACSHALLRQKTQALEALRRAVMLGYADLDFLLNDSDLTSLHGHTDFQSIVTYLASQPGAQHVI
jgi:tetratricopeptide (TPR) repeat protein